ncbi:MAG: FHA domain-containing protein [Myxococcaceae bacterium]
MAPPRKTVSRGGGDVENDPERANQTQLPREEMDPEVNNATQARAPNPLKKKKGGGDDPERANKTQARAKAPESDEESYHTGQSYAASEDAGDGEDIAGSPSMSLEGDGLEALDPEVGSRTKALPALETETPSGGSGDEEEGADDANATRAGPPLKLEIVGGPDAGKKKKFKGVRMVIGRTPGVDLQLSDASVSRRHVELIYGDDGVLLKDLGSGNGTKVNGSKVAEKKLEHGDEISIGKTKIRFVDELAAFKKAREDNEKKEADKKEAAEKKKADKKEGEGEGEAAAAESPGSTIVKEGGDEAAEGDGEGEGKKPERKGGRVRPVRTARGEGADGGFAAKFKALPKGVRFGVIGLVTVILLIFIVGVALRPPPAPPVDPAKLQADQKMQDGRNAVREGDFERAVALIDEAEKLQPGIDKTNLGKQAREELNFMNALDVAKKAIAEKRFDDAKKAIASTGKGSVKSEEARIKVKAELDAAELEYKKAKIDEFIAAGEIEAARSLLAELPVEMQAEPGQKIAEFERELEEQKALEAKDAKAAAAAAAARKKAQREQEIQEAFVVVERKFAGGEWDRAASECNRVMDALPNDKDIYGRARKLQGIIPSFGRNYDEGMKKFRQGAKAQAAKPLRIAYQQYEQMNLRANKYGQELQDKIGESAIAAGKEALIRDDLVTAWQNFKDAARFDPNDAAARAGLDDVAAKAEDLFQTAYVIRDRDQREAVRKFKIVIQVTDPGSSVHEKAKNQLAAMAP